MERVLIIGGNMNRTLPHRLKYCDTVFYLDFSSIVCLVGVISRTIKYYGIMKEHPEKSSGNGTKRFICSEDESDRKIKGIRENQIG